MRDEKPYVGQVIRHWYLWRDESRQGLMEGRKARPCVIVRLFQNDFNETEVFIAPITHTAPIDPRFAKEIPIQTKQRLKLDSEISWIITNEVNRFTWKGTDLAKTPNGTFTYGFLPANFSKELTKEIRQHATARRLAITKRDDEALLKRIRDARARDES